MGQALGKEDLAEPEVKAYEERAAGSVRRSRRRRANCPRLRRPLRRRDTVRLYVENSYSGLVLKDVGFPRPEDQPTEKDSIAVDISQENIAELDADHIFVAAYAGSGLGRAVRRSS